jgi:hypothetical protein
MGYADRVPNKKVMSEHRWIPRGVPILGPTDRHLCCCPCKRQKAVVTGSGRLWSAVEFAAHQHGSDDASHLVGQRDRRQLFRLARQQLQKPGRIVTAGLVGFAAPLDLLDDGSGAEHQQSAQAFIALPADLAEPLPPRRRVLARCDPEPGGKMTTGTKDRGIGHREGDADGGDRPTPGMVASNWLRGSAL